MVVNRGCYDSTYYKKERYYPLALTSILPFSLSLNYFPSNDINEEQKRNRIKKDKSNTFPLYRCFELKQWVNHP